MAEIIKGEAYSVAFSLKNNGTAVTPETVDGVRIALGNQTASWPDGSLTYSTDDQTWRFPLSQANSYAIVGNEVNYQAQLKIAGEVFSSRKRKITVYDTMFRREWDEA